MKNYRITRYRALCFAIAVLLLGCALAAWPSASATSFTVHANIPENQVDKRQTYFDLRLSPGEEQVIELVVDNFGDESINADISLCAASTGQDGLIIYTANTAPDDSMQFPVTDIATVLDPQVSIPAGNSATVRVRLTMPEEAFDGVMLGGLSVQASPTVERDDEPTGGVTLANRLMYVVGLKITQTDEEVSPDFHLISIEPGLINYRPSLALNLQNDQAAIAKNMQVNAKVYKDGSDEPFRELSLGNAEMAPNSNGNFVVDWMSSPLQAGDYRLHMTVDHDGDRWEWDEMFHISAENAGVINDGALGLERSYRALYILLTIVLIAAIGILAYWLGTRRRRDTRA